MRLVILSSDWLIPVGKELFNVDKLIIGHELVDHSLETHQDPHQLTLVLILVTGRSGVVLGISVTTGDTHDEGQGIEEPA